MSDQRGSVIVTFVVFLPVLFLMATLAVDVSGFFVHDRHLQSRADAAALAAVGDIDFPNCNNGKVLQTSQINAGLIKDPSTNAFYNDGLGSSKPSVHLATNASGQPTLNWPTFYQQPSKPSPADGTDQDPPCTSRQVDVKLSEDNLPWFFGLADKVFPFFVNSHARAKVFTRTESSESLPVGVPDPRPNWVHAWVVDEAKTCSAASNGCVLKSAELTNEDADITGTPLAGWSGTVGGVNFAGIDSAASVVFGLSGAPTGAGKTSPMDNDLVASCARPLVTCYQPGATPADPPASGLSFIHVYSEAGTPADSGVQPNSPKVRSVQLTGASGCASPEAQFVTTATCTVGLRARVDFGTGTKDPRLAKPDGVHAFVCARLAGDKCPNNTGNWNMDYDTASGWWSTTTPIAVPNTNGRQALILEWAEEDGTVNIGGTDSVCKSNNNPCTGTLNSGKPVQVVYRSSGKTSGPIGFVGLSEASPPLTNSPYEDAHSFRSCGGAVTACTHDLTVRIGIAGSLKNAGGVNDPVVRLRIGSDTPGSQTQALQCDKFSDLADDLRLGCVRRYKVNTGQDCSTVKPVDLFASAEPWQCVAVQTGATPNKVGDGLNARILCGGQPCGNSPSCTHPNNWRDPLRGFGTTAGLSDDDPRIIQVFLTPYGSFTGSGQETVAVKAFATMYVTGWDGQGSSKNPCQTDPSLDANHKDDAAVAGEVVGHFIKYVDPTAEQTPPTELCDPNAFASCFGALTD